VVGGSIGFCGVDVKTRGRFRVGTMRLDEFPQERILTISDIAETKPYMQTIILRTFVVAGLTVGLSTIGVASPTIPLVNPDIALRNSQVQQAYYTYNHHRYQHRAWDKRRKRWRYYRAEPPGRNEAGAAHAEGPA
jgi:hypothetical protein